ncbi:MAG TPA: hypothetical protein VFR14_04345 [Candidatus Limnocylindrales bacterium]|nr:hypothetical protein [Candidatus Limnocylindrales bacterium]
MAVRASAAGSVRDAAGGAARASVGERTGSAIESFEKRGRLWRRRRQPIDDMLGLEVNDREDLLEPRSVVGSTDRWTIARN